MPFTVAHAAAVLPVRKVGFVISAFVVGTFAPDFEYFVRLTPRIRIGHTWPGVLFITVPACLTVLWLFHAFLKRPAAALLPVVMERRIAPYLEGFRFGGIRRFSLIVLSLSAGIGTHLLWDLFTHPHTWATRHWPVLLQSATLPILGEVLLYKLLQETSTAIGLAALTIWFLGWLRTSRPIPKVESCGLRASHRLTIVLLMIAVAACGASTRTLVLFGTPTDANAAERFIGVLGVTAISFFSLSFVTYAAWWTWIRRVRD